MAQAEFTITSGHPEDGNVHSFKCKLGPVLEEDSLMCGTNLLHGIFGILLNRQRNHDKGIKSWIDTVVNHAYRLNKEYFKKHVALWFNLYELKQLEHNLEVKRHAYIEVDDHFFINTNKYNELLRETNRMKEVLSFWFEELEKKGDLQKLINEHSRRFQAYDARDEFSALIKELEGYNRNQEELERTEYQQRVEEEMQEQE